MGGRKININYGDTFGRLTVIKEVNPRKDKKGRDIRRILCVCECGKETEVDLYELIRKNKSIKSCGCLSSEASSKNITKYNKSEERLSRDEQKKIQRLNSPEHYKKEIYDRLYNIWNAMKKRCYYEYADSYKYYGAKGIKICDEWMVFSNFVDWALNNGYANNLTIDRIDNTKNYCPDNCRWSTPTEQANNTSRNHFLENKNGERHTIAEWARILKINYNRLYSLTRRKKFNYIEDLGFSMI